MLCSLLYQCLNRLMIVAAFVGAQPAGAQVDFNRDIRPILSDVCFQCHGPDSQTRVSELRLDTRAGLFAKLDDVHIVVPGDPSASELIRRISSEDSDVRMPPTDSKLSLTKSQIDQLTKWVSEGASWDMHWAFVAPQRPKLPVTTAPDWCRNAIDHFVLKRLDDAGLVPSPLADRRTLLRRASLDLTGLPPTPKEVAAFLNDTSPDAWQRVLTRLLSSSRYGERQAVDWLDAARYADTSGYQNDGPRDMWRWRDWVLDAFNSNMPYDRFTIEQLAGDLLPRASLSQKIATGFNRNHRGNAEGGIIPEEYQVEYVVDRVDTTATVWLGLTMGCARCHDHKYDPITQKDFYRTFAWFNTIPESGRAIKEGNSPPWIKAPTDEQAATLEKLRRDADDAEQKAVQLESRLADEIRKWEPTRKPRQLDDWTITRGLVARLRLDGDMSDSAPQSEQREQAADTASPQFSGGKFGRAAAFTGQAAAKSGDIGNFGYFDRFSIAAWIRPAAADGTVVSRMKPVEQGNGYSVHLQDGRIQVNLVKRWLDDSIRVESRDTVQLDEWQHIVVTYDGTRVASGISIFVDGAAVPVTVQLDGINQSFAVDEPLRIGGGHSNFTGLIDDVHVYDRVLTSTEAAILSVPRTMSEILTTNEQDRSDREQGRLRAAFLDRLASEPVQKAMERVVATRSARDEFFRSIPTVMIMQEMNTPRTTHVLKRGQYDAPGEKVEPGVPGVLPQLPADAPRTRLGFAQWLVSPENPLTARVAVNRIWQQHFGTGLVRTTEDFGAQGESPSHPKLLDWLATEFVRSGWDMKAMHRLIMTSATYRQSSATRAQFREPDPDNRLLSRGPRYRLPAEIVRDQALFVSGLLRERVGGPSVRPYQPAGLWKEIASTTEYNQSHGDDLYRRSLYTYWKRTVAPPTMVTLDATSRESCIVKRSRTNTPLQALALMNDVTFVEAARAMAQRVMNSADPAPESRVRHAFELATCRPPAQDELQILTGAFERALTVFRNKPEAAARLLEVGESAAPKSSTPEELAAWTTVTSIILNLDEVVTLE